jgi:hypothetical protein
MPGFIGLIYYIKHTVLLVRWYCHANAAQHTTAGSGLRVRVTSGYKK